MKKNPFTQKIVPAQAITMTDWLSMKPYKQPIHGYDIYYLQQCQVVFRQLNKEETWFKFYGLSQTQLKELTCQLVSYFEDYINDIGIWNAFVDTNEALYGYPLPFYDVSEHDKTYINIEDIAFLIWHYLTKYSDEEYLINPDHDTIMGLAKTLFAHFENIMDDSLAIDFYEAFFTIKDKADYFAFKNKMEWFTTESYLLGVDFRRKLENEKAKLMQHVKNDPEGAAYVPIVLYNLLEVYLYQKRSSFSALNGPEWFAKVAKCSEQSKAEILDLTYWIDGKFILKERQKEHLIFEHLLTNITYKARLDSFKNNKNLKPSDNVASQMHLIRWDGEYMLSGMMVGEEVTPLSLKQYKASALKTPWILSDKAISEMYKHTQIMYEAFVEFFEGELVTFDTYPQLSAANEAFLDFYKKKANHKMDKSDERLKKYRELLGKSLTTRIDNPFDKDAKSFAMFFIKDVSSYTFKNAKQTIALLKAPTLTPDEEAYLFVDFANGLIPPVCAYLLKKYGSKNLRFPTIDNKMDVVKYLPFFHRMNSPEEFDRAYPLMTLVSTEDLDK